MLPVQFYLSSQSSNSLVSLWEIIRRIQTNKKEFVNDFPAVNPLLIYFFSLHFLSSFFSALLCSVSSFPQVLSDTTVLLLYLLNSAAAARHTYTHFLRHKTMSARRIFLAACSTVYCMILDALKANLCSHTYLVALSLPFYQHQKIEFLSLVVPCDVPVPDKSLMSLCACRQRQTPARLFVGVCYWLFLCVFQAVFLFFFYDFDVKSKIYLIYQQRTWKMSILFYFACLNHSYWVVCLYCLK